jgi:hypothetical protein
MLVCIAEDVLRHVVRQRVVRFILDGDARHRDTPRKVVCYDRRDGGVSVALIPFTLLEAFQRIPEIDQAHLTHDRERKRRHDPVTNIAPKETMEHARLVQAV